MAATKPHKPTKEELREELRKRVERLQAEHEKEPTVETQRLLYEARAAQTEND